MKSRRVGGATYQVPVEVRPERRIALAMRWLAILARPRREDDGARASPPSHRRVEGRGNAVKKKEDTHKMAEANKAFAHYRF